MLGLLAWALILYMSVINELWLALVFHKYYNISTTYGTYHW